MAHRPRHGSLRRARLQLRLLREGLPGRRFQEYHGKHRPDARRSQRWVYGAGGVALILVGLVTYPIPGPPSTLMVAVGAALLARSSRRAARVLDGMEMRVRRSLGRRRSLTALAAGAGAAAGGWWWIALA